ncbi:MAG: peptidylprolyl isomerase [Niastella sp.]|nr:peptidylprolyl isomerase [Niastella sp.]
MRTILTRGFLSIVTVLSFLCSRSQVSLLNPDDPAFSKPAPDSFKVQLQTTKGEILMEVKRAWSPRGVDRFYNLIVNGYYDNLPMFRIRAGYWAQFGIAGDPKIAQAWRNKNIPDDPRMLSNARGTVAYAFKDPNARTTQLFINLRDNSSTHDNEPFVPIARVIKGMDVADALYSGYGEKAGGGIRAGKQDSAFAGGNPYWKQNFPLLDYIKTTKIIK